MLESYRLNLPGARPSGSMSHRRVAAIILRRKLLVSTLFVGIFGLVAAITLLMPRQYESRMKVLVKNERADLVVSPDARDTGVVHGEVNETQVNSEIELLSSNDLLVRVVRVCRLYGPTAGVVEAAGKPQPESFERAVRKLGHDLKIAPVRKANVIQVTYSAPSPELAAAVLRELSAAYLDAHLTIHRTAGTTEFFRKQADLYESRLNAAHDQLREFRARHNVSSVPEQKELLLRKVLDLETTAGELDAALAEVGRRVLELRQQVARQAPRIVTQSRTVSNQYSVERLNTMLAELENRRTQALSRFRPEDRTVVEIEQEITNTRTALDRAAKLSATEQATEVNPIRQDLERDLTRAEIQERALESRRVSVASTVSTYKTRLTEVENATSDLDLLQRAVKESEDNYLLYAKKKEEARIADSLDQQKISNVAIAETPVEHYLPSSPNVALNLALGLFLATFVSLGAAFTIEFADHSFYGPQELGKATNTPVRATYAHERLDAAE
jgi:uncharacterized protein involved in exopolysaccharide biosynthesis